MFVDSYEGKLSDLQDKSDDMKTFFEQMLVSVQYFSFEK